MQTINIHETKTHLSRLLEQALPGAMKGEIRIADDFDENLSSIPDCLNGQ